MKLKQQINLKRLKDLNLEGVEIESTTQDEHNNITGIHLRDTITNEPFSIQLGQYSGLCIIANKEPKIEEVFLVKGTLKGGVFERQFKTEKEASEFIVNELDSCSTVSIQKTDIEVLE